MTRLFLYRSLSFNAATTRRSWRTSWRPGWSSHLIEGFNAATTRRSWRTTSDRNCCMNVELLQCGHDPKVVENRSRSSFLIVRSDASMRPRPEGRGEPKLCFGSPSPFSPLQCGHDPKVVENRECFWGDDDVRYSFNAATTRRSWRTRDDRRRRRADTRASMRPRPEGRGERPRQGRCALDRLGFNAATTRRSWRTPASTLGSAPGRRLQCGHDPKVVENDRRQSFHRSEPCGFNAATTRRSWRTSPGSSSRWRARRELQCGHDPKVVENMGGGKKSAQVRVASMRPRPEGRGEPAVRGTIGGVDSVLQCGHDPKVVENPPRHPVCCRW